MFKELNDGETKDREELVGRYEELTRLAEEVTVGAEGAKPVDVAPLLKDDEGFRLYLRALASLAASSAADPSSYFAKMNSAPLKRQALLEQSSAAAAPLAATAPGTTSPAQSTLSPPALVTALFSGAGGRGKGGDAKISSLGSFAAWPGTGSAAASSSSVGSDPIRVVVEEAKGSVPLRAIRFVFVTLLYSFLLCVFFFSTSWCLYPSETN